MLKFRTMHANNDTAFPLTLAGDGRITPLGACLRVLHLDELPQLINIIRGDMSLIGPRPEIPEFVNSAETTWQEIFKVKPGLFDKASLVFTVEGQLLASATDWRTCYRTEILPGKLALSLEEIRTRTSKSDLCLWGGLF